MTTFSDFWGKLVGALNDASQNVRQRAKDIYHEIGSHLTGNVSANQFMNRHPERLQQLDPKKHLGRMVAYYYDPKHKKTLPYYDRLPLVIPFSFEADGFRGINFHYLPPQQRAMLYYILVKSDIYAKCNDEKEKLQVTYAVLQRIFGKKKTGQWRDKRKPVLGMNADACVKMYLYEKIAGGRVYVVPPDEWEAAIWLNIERFEKKSKQQVWADSIKGNSK